MDESELAGTVYIFVATKYKGKLLKNCNEGELSWHKINDVELLEELAGHQKFFLAKILKNDNYFYTGIAVYNNDKLLAYTDSEKYFECRKK